MSLVNTGGGSRYTTGGYGVAAPAPGSNTNVANGTNSSTTSGTSNTTSQQHSINQTQSMSPENLAALNVLIQQLMNGGSPEERLALARRNQEAQYVQGERGQYSKASAFNDAQGAMAQQMRLALEKLVPGLTRSAEGAGTSQNSMRALMLQQAGSQAAEAASALGLKAAVDYGGINTNLSSIMERLTQPDNTVMNSLLNAFNIAKGSQTTSTTDTSGSQNTATSGQTDGTTSQTTTGSAGGSRPAGSSYSGGNGAIIPPTYSNGAGLMSPATPIITTGVAVPDSYKTPMLSSGPSQLDLSQYLTAPSSMQATGGNLVDMLSTLGAYGQNGGWDDYTF